MPLFKSSREKRYWLYACIVLVALIVSLIFAESLVRLSDNEELLGLIGFLGMLLIAATIIVHGLKTRPSKVEITVWLGLAAVFLILYMRIGHPERTHLMEYGVMAIFIHKALMERASHIKKISRPGLLAFLLTALIGALDEFIQLLLPGRVFDPIDILFNTLAAFASIGASLIILWVRKRFNTK